MYSVWGVHVRWIRFPKISPISESHFSQKAYKPENAKKFSTNIDFCEGYDRYTKKNYFHVARTLELLRRWRWKHKIFVSGNLSFFREHQIMFSTRFLGMIGYTKKAIHLIMLLMRLNVHKIIIYCDSYFFLKIFDVRKNIVLFIL